MDEISENIKRTFKKYNEISLDTDTTPQVKDSNDEARFNSQNDADDNSLNYLKPKTPNVIADYDGNSISFQNTTVPKPFASQIKQILDTLDSFEESINNDFKDLEQFIENSVEKELQKCYR